MIILYFGRVSASPGKSVIKRSFQKRAFSIRETGHHCGSELSPESTYWFASHLPETTWNLLSSIAFLPPPLAVERRNDKNVSTVLRTSVLFRKLPLLGMGTDVHGT